MLDADDVNLGRTGHLVANDRALTRDDIDDTSGQPRLGHHLSKLSTVLRRELTRLNHNGTTGNQGSTGLTGNEEEREIPRQDTCYNADGFLREQDGLVGTVGGDDLALDVAGEGGHILKVGNGGAHLNGGPGAGLALFAHDDLGELLLTLLDAVSHLQ